MSTIYKILRKSLFHEPANMPKRSYTDYQATNLAARKNPRSAYQKRYRAAPRMAPAPKGEMKYFDCERAANIAACTTTWVAGTMQDPDSTINLGDAAVATPNCLFAPKVSAALNGRIGRKVLVHKVKVRGAIFVPVQAAQNAADASTLIRVVLAEDKQTNAAQMTGAQLFNDATLSSETVNSFQNPNHFGRFRVLKDRMFQIRDLNMVGSPTANDVVQTGYAIPFKIFKSFKKQPIKVNFNATNGGTVADVIDHSFHMLVGANSIAYAPSISYYSRVAYTDA